MPAKDEEMLNILFNYIMKKMEMTTLPKRVRQNLLEMDKE